MITYLCVRLFANLYGIEMTTPFNGMCFFISCFETAFEIAFLFIEVIPGVMKRIGCDK